MWLFLKKLFLFFDRPGKIRIGGLLVLMGIVTLLEMLGLGLIYPLIEVIKSPDAIRNLPLIKSFFPASLLADSKNIFWIVGFALVLAYVVKNLFLLLLIYLQNRFVKNRIALISHQMLDGYLSLPYTFFLQRNTAEFLRNIENSITTIFNKGLLALLYIVMDGVVIVGLLTVLLIVDPLSTLVVAAGLGGGLFLFYRALRKHLLRWGESEHRLIADVYKWIHQSIGAVKEIKVLGREQFLSSKFAQAVMGRTKPLIALSTVKQSPRVFFEILVIVGMFMVFVTTNFQGKPLDSTLTILVMFAVASLRLLPSINRIAASAMSIKGAVPVLDALHADYQMILGNKNQKRVVLPNGRIPFEANIRCDNMSFSYPETSAPTLKNIELEIQRGETIGIVGPTGAGKTTLVDVLLGLLPPSKGRLLVDEHDVQENLRSWQDRIGYVPQKIYLTDDTLRRNIAFGVDDKEINEERVRKAMRHAHLEELLDGLPKGLETMVGERGVRLSGGQSQRVGIARALYHDPEVLIMDEATSALDNQTEYAIAKAIHEIAQAKTLVIIAHRLSTVRECDRLIYIKNGAIVDIGGFDEIVARNPDFQRQVKLGDFVKTS